MPITNNNLPVIDLPVWEILQPLPIASSIGVCMCCDKRGSGRTAYLLISATQFWRYDLYANTYQQLANPPGGTVGGGTVMTFDPSQGTAGVVWALISSGVGAPTWQMYDIATNTWTVKSVVNLPATFGTDAGLVHTDSTYNAAGNDDFIYLIGNAGTVLYRYSISGNAWIATLAAVPAAVGAGCSIHWLPGYDTNKLVALRGAASNNIYEYNISGNTWASVTFQPTTETFTTGTMACTRGGGTGSRLLVQKDATMRVYELAFTAPATATFLPVVTQYLVTPGAAIAGDRFFYVKEANGVEFLYFGVPTSSVLLRTPLFF
jgi:hypothetical protein